VRWRLLGREALPLDLSGVRLSRFYLALLALALQLDVVRLLRRLSALQATFLPARQQHVVGRNGRRCERDGRALFALVGYAATR
jgi:hypothetical protein